VRGWALCNRRL